MQKPTILSREASKDVDNEEYAIIDLEAEARIAREKVRVVSFRKSKESFGKKKVEPTNFYPRLQKNRSWLRRSLKSSKLKKILKAEATKKKRKKSRRITILARKTRRKETKRMIRNNKLQNSLNRNTRIATRRN